MANLSKLWNAQKFHRIGVGGIDYDPNSQIELERFDLISQTVQNVAGLFYDLMSNSYMTPVVVTADTAGRKNSANGSWVAATNTLTATMDSSVISSDVGKGVDFIIGSSYYCGTILTYVSASSFTVEGLNLPTTDGTVTTVLILPTKTTSDVIDISNLRTMRTGNQIKIELESSSTNYVRPIASYELKSIRTSAVDSIDAVYYAFSGDQILLKKGDNITSYGTLTLRYPRIPRTVTTDTSAIDIPDGSAMDIALMKYRMTVADRLGRAKIDNASELKYMISTLYRSFGQEVDAEAIESKYRALK